MQHVKSAVVMIMTGLMFEMTSVPMIAAVGR